MNDNEGDVIDAAVSEAKPPMAVRDHRASQLAERAPAGAIDTSPPAVIARMMQMGATVAELKGMLEVQREWEADVARKAFNAAFAAFKSEAVRIIKGTLVTDGPLKGKKYANLFDIVNAVSEPLARHGLATSWRLTKDEKDWMEVTCILRHAAGHSESDTQGGAPDTGPGRNAIQSRRSTRTYLEKSTLTGITGLAASDADDDGGGGGDDPGAPEQRGGADKSPYDDGAFKRNLPAWRELVATGKKTPAAILASLESKALLLDSQRKSIRELGGAK